MRVNLALASKTLIEIFEKGEFTVQLRQYVILPVREQVQRVIKSPTCQSGLPKKVFISYSKSTSIWKVHNIELRYKKYIYILFYGVKAVWTSNSEDLVATSQLQTFYNCQL